MKGLFIPKITSEMFRNGCLESIEALMAEGEIYDIEYTGWIPVEWHEITDDEREREGYPKEWVAFPDCVMPDDEQEILITVKSPKGRLWVKQDINYMDDGYYLDSGYDWIEDVVAWMPLPEPYVENYSIKTVTNAKDAENYPISEDTSKCIEKINKLLFENGQAESEDKK